MLLKILNQNIQTTSCLYILFLLMVACQSPNIDSIDSDISYANIQKIGEVPQLSFEGIKISQIEIQDLDNPVGIGFSYVLDNQLLFFDRIRGEVLEINLESGGLKLIISQGDGPDEIPKFQSFTHNSDKRIFLNGYAFFVYDSNWEQTSRGTYDFFGKDVISDVASNPHGAMIGTYEIKYYMNQPYIIDDKLWINIESSNPNFNFIMHESYYRDSRIVGEVNLKTGEIEKILGRKPPIYLNYRFIPHHDYYYLTPFGDDFLISFEPDSAIYLVDKELKPKSYFGTKGVNMDQSYVEMSEIEDWESYWFTSRAKKGYYKQIWASEEENLVMRTYTLGNKNDQIENLGDNPKRLQIFKDFQLIGDVEVPTYFKVIGKIGEYYYADGSGENPDNEEILIYRFKID